MEHCWPNILDQFVRKFFVQNVPFVEKLFRSQDTFSIQTMTQVGQVSFFPVYLSLFLFSGFFFYVFHLHVSIVISLYRYEDH